MLCNLCGELRLNLSQQNSKTLIRRYSNLDELKSKAATCENCALLYDSCKVLRSPDTLSHCKGRWGPAFDEALELAPIDVYHVTVNEGHNVVWTCGYDVWKCKSYSAGPKAFAWEGEFGGLYVNSTSPIAPYLLGREFSPDLSATQMLDQAKSWHQTCQIQHPECALQNRQVPLPKRLVDLGTHNDSDFRPRLHISSEDSTGAYLTLSYCWGESESIRLTQDSISSFRTHGIPLDRGPRTLQDSFRVCRDLGFRFIWIDCLCIVQDSEEDWKQQSSEMGTIYSQAAITIRAAAGSGCDHGIFAPRFKHRGPSVKIPCVVSGKATGECFLRRQPLNGITEPLDKRGWALQEALLAGRVLTFGSVEMTWECRHGIMNESGFSTRISIPAGDILPRPLREKQYYTYLDGTLRDNLDYVNNSSHKQFGKDRQQLFMWQRIVEAYSSRSLTFQKDKLPAIAGIAWKYLQANIGKEASYLAGLWSSHLPESLLWFHDLPADVDASKPEIYRAPSWSWASLDCQYLEWVPPSRLGIICAQVVHVETKLAGSDIFGQVTSGSITIKAPFRQGSLLPSPWYRDSFNLWGDDWREKYNNRQPGMDGPRLGSARFDMRRTSDDLIDSDQPMIAYCLMITNKAALLLEPCEEMTSNSLWRRVGVVQLFDMSGKWMEGCWENTVTII